jgi:hypothetical protein
LIELLKGRNLNLAELPTTDIPEESFSTYDVEKLEVIPLLFQTGYLTVRDYRSRGNRRLYTLGYPNYEIEESFNTWLAAGYSNTERALVGSCLSRILGAFDSNDLETVFESLQVFFAGIPNTITLKREKYYQSLLYVIFRMIGLETDAEVSTHRGRIDAVVETRNHIFLFEFKLSGTSELALAQIREKEYFKKYLDRGKPITLVGASFHPEARNIEDWKAEPLQR